MADKFLSESEWKKIAKGRDLKDAPLIKALTAFEKARDAQAQLDALDDVEKQADTLRKAGKGDKELGAFLDGLDKSLDRERKLAKAAAKEAEASEEEEEEDTPTLLTTKMIPLLRQVKKGEEMQVMVAYGGGKEVAVLMSRRAISPSKRKLLTEYLAAGTQKIAMGHCIFEEKAYTFVLQTQAGGMAKKLKAALLKQVELRLKVRVRGDSPDDIDDDGDEAEDESQEASNEAAQAPAASAAPADAPSTNTAAPDPLKGDYDKRLAAVMPTVMTALKAQGPDAAKVRALIEFAREKGGEAHFKAALGALDSLEKLLSAEVAAPAPTAAPAPSSSADEAADFKVRLAALLPRIKAAQAAGGPDEIKLLVAQAGASAVKKEFARGNALLDEVQALLDRVGSAPSSTASTSADAGKGNEGEEEELEEEGKKEEEDGEEDGEEDETGEESGPDPKDVQDRFKMIGVQMGELKGLPEFVELKAGFDLAAAAFRKHDWTEVVAQLDEIEPEVIAALSAARALAARPGGPSLVALSKASLAWRQAYEQAHQEIAALKTEVIASLVEEDELEEEELDDVRTELDRLDGIFETFSPRLSDLIDTAINAAPDKRRKTLEQVVSMAAQAESAIQSDPMIAAAKSNGVRDIDIAGPALQALGTLREAVGPALAV